MRWLDELLHPAKKCERIGHRMIERRTRVYLYPPAHRWSSVADRAVEVNEVCRRCGHATEPSVANRDGLQGLGMPSHHWDRLRETGRIAA